MQLELSEAHPQIRSLALRGRILERNLVLAPMAGVTNLPFRLIAREAGAALVYTETVSARGLATGGRKSWALVESSPRERPLAYQIFGSDPEVLGEAARMLVERGAEFVDLNLGCPVKKFIRNGAGAALLRHPPRIAPLVRAMRRALPDGVLSVKMRLGWDARSITAPEVARIAEAEGCDLVSVHGRTRAQQYSGSVDRECIAEVVGTTRLPVLANGDVRGAPEALAMLRETGAAGVMIGRGALANPWIFREIVELAEGRPLPQPTIAERARLAEHHLAIMLEHLGEVPAAVHVLKKYLCAWTHGMAGAGRFRERINRARELDALLREAGRFFREAA